MPWKETNAMNQKSEFVLRAMRAENFRALCREYGISAKTGYKWKERFLADGFGGLNERSRRPRCSPRGLAEWVVCELVRLKQAPPSWGPRKVRELYARAHERQAPSESSIKRVLGRAGFVERRRLRSRESSGRMHSGRKAKAPNEVWTVDFKGWWHGCNGMRCEPLTVRDEFSRYVLELRAVENSRSETVKVAFERLFERYGLPEAIRSDNGAPFAARHGLLGLTRLSAWWLALGIDLERGRPGCPQDNGGHERMHLDLARELEAARLGEDQATLDLWRETFNYERPHEALAMRTPAEVYQTSARKYAGATGDLSYARMHNRRVHPHGCILWRGEWIFLSKCLSGWSVGLDPSEDEIWDVWFGRLCVGRLDTRQAKFWSATAELLKEKTVT